MLLTQPVAVEDTAYNAVHSGIGIPTWGVGGILRSHYTI